MSLMMRCIETYDAMEHLAGKCVNEDKKEALAPVGHKLADATIEITVDDEGNFVRAQNVEKKAVIPCSEESAGRTGTKKSAHPLCDYLGYVSSFYNEKKHKVYIDELRKWVESKYSSKIIQAIYQYVTQNSIYEDLLRNGVKIKSEKDFVIWRVVGFGDESGSVCENETLHKLYQAYYLSNKNDNLDFCMATGNLAITTTKHINVSKFGKAKLISSNDAYGFTYKGRFLDGREACSIGYEASQKAHNALNWVLANEGIHLGNRICVAWNPQGKIVPKIQLPIAVQCKQAKPEASTYKNELRKKVFAYSKLFLKGEQVVIAMFDAANPGRLAVTYYNEMPGISLVKKLEKWDETTLFKSIDRGAFVPSLYKYVAFSYGIYRTKNSNDAGMFEMDEKIQNKQMQRLIACRIDNKMFPIDILKRLVINSSNLGAYDRNTRNQILHTTCSAIRKYYIDKLQEDISMALEKEKKNRSYQYGRLLAVLEKIEQDTYDKKETMRETNAIRLQQRFVQKPLETSEQIVRKLKQAYYRKLKKPAITHYEKLIEEILCVISECKETELDKSLDEMYLIGYYLQKQDLYKETNGNTDETAISD